LPVDPRLQLLDERADSLRGRVAVLARVDGYDRGAADGLGHVEIGLADRKIDRALHLGGQVEYLANARAIKPGHAMSDPGM